tara:strand:+ start:7430 stop:7648 length:219 start_codon:yes stop_codon:yes gene_type:complete
MIFLFYQAARSIFIGFNMLGRKPQATRSALKPQSLKLDAILATRYVNACQRIVATRRESREAPLLKADPGDS